MYPSHTLVLSHCYKHHAEQLTDINHASNTDKFSIATIARETAKHRKYDNLCEQYQWRMVPFVMETYGALGKEALQYINEIIADCEHPLSAQNYLLNCLSVALQIGNGSVANIGILRKQQIRMNKDRHYVKKMRAHLSF